MPARNISPKRDLLQSRILVIVVVPVVALLAVWTLRLTPRDATHSLWSVVISLVFAGMVRGVRAATLPGAVCGALICVILSQAGYSPAHSGLLCLALLFLLTFLATHLGRSRKEAQGLGEARSGRQASQVVANLGVAGVCAAFALDDPVLAGCCVAALAEATADTVSSEIGQAFGGTPWMLTSLRRVPAGTDGAISLTGTAAGMVGAVVVVAASIPTLNLTHAEAALAGVAGIFGLFFDSMLGATLERGGWINNDLVNFVSTGFAAALALALFRRFVMH